MRYDAKAGANPVDAMKIVGKPVDRIDGPLKTTGAAPYAYEQHDLGSLPAYGYPVGSAVAKGRIADMDLSQAKASPGVIAIVTAQDAGPVGKGEWNTARLLGGPDVEHYHQAIALVVAETFEQARAAAALVRVRYVRAPGQFELTTALLGAAPHMDQPDRRVGDFERAFAAAPLRHDATYTTADQSHVMLEPHATIAEWSGNHLTLWTSTQMVAGTQQDMATALGMPAKDIRIIAPYIGGGFGAKLFLRADVVLAALGARAAGRPVKLALPRPFSINNTTHRPATIQRVRLGCTPDGKIVAIGHESWSGDLAKGHPERSTEPTRLLYAGANRLLRTRLAILDLPEGNAMRAPGEASGLMALEIAMDEMAERLGIDPVRFRIANDTQVSPEDPTKSFSQRKLVECLQVGAARFGWDRRGTTPGQQKDGRWLSGMGVAAGIRGGFAMSSAARVRLDGSGRITVETDMTDIGTGSYTIIAQTAAEVMGVPIDSVSVRLGDSRFPVSAGSAGQCGATSATAGVYAACMALRAAVVRELGLDPASIVFADGMVQAGERHVPLARAARNGEIVAEDGIQFGPPDEDTIKSTFAAHFVEVAVDRYTGEIRVRRMLAVCAAGRILNAKTARSQVIGAMTMGVGAALSEELAVDTRFGFFVNHDLAGYEVAVHADIQHQDVIFLDEPDAAVSPTKAKGVGEVGLCGVAAAIANAVYNATGIRVRRYPITLDHLLDGLPPV